jgi:hypothetical protein
MKRYVVVEDDTEKNSPRTVWRRLSQSRVQGEDVLRKEIHAFPPNKLMLLGINVMHNLDHQRKK